MLSPTLCASARRIAGGVFAAGALTLSSCGSDGPSETGQAATQPPSSVGRSTPSSSGSGAVAGVLFPDVVAVEITALGNREFAIAATLSSPYDSPERYADAWRVLDAVGNELGVRELTHDHASEQPFTRSEIIMIPDGIDEVTVQGHDQVSGYGGETVTVGVPR